MRRSPEGIQGNPHRVTSPGMGEIVTSVGQDVKVNFPGVSSFVTRRVEGAQNAARRTRDAVGGTLVDVAITGATAAVLFEALPQINWKKLAKDHDVADIAKAYEKEGLSPDEAAKLAVQDNIGDRPGGKPDSRVKDAKLGNEGKDKL